MITRDPNMPVRLVRLETRLRARSTPARQPIAVTPYSNCPLDHGEDEATVSNKRGARTGASELTPIGQTNSLISRADKSRSWDALLPFLFGFGV